MKKIDLSPFFLSSLLQRKDDEFAVRLDERGVGHSDHSVPQLQHVVALQLEWVLVDVDRRAEGEVVERRVGHLDVRAHHMHNRLVRDEAHQALHARQVGVKVRDVAPSGVERVAGEQQARLPVVQGDVRRLVTRYGNDVDDAATAVGLSPTTVVFGWPWNWESPWT